MRFPESFCFQLTQQELIDPRSQNGTLSLRNNITYGGLRYLPYVLTVMLSGLLKIDIVAMRKYISSTIVNQSFINELVLR